MRCVLHIGTEKTGTTELQAWLYANEAALSEQGIYLSHMLGVPHNIIFAERFIRVLDDWTRRRGMATLDEKERFFSGFDAEFEADVAAARKSHSIFIISSEFLHSRIRDRETLEEIRRFLDRFFSEVWIVCYFRHQPDMAVSHYSTEVRVGRPITLDEYLAEAVQSDNYYYDFQQIADNWSSVFGKENCDFHLYDRKHLRQGDIRKDFLTTLGKDVDEDSLEFPVSDRNPSLSALKAAVFRQINTAHPLFDDEERGINRKNRKIKQAINTLECLDHGKIGQDRKAEIEQRFKESNAAFLAEYFGPGSSFPAVKEPQPERDLTMSEVIEIVDQLSEALLNSAAENPAILNRKDRAALSEISRRITPGKPLSQDDAEFLAALSKRTSPYAPLPKTRTKRGKRAKKRPRGLLRFFGARG